MKTSFTITTDSNTTTFTDKEVTQTELDSIVTTISAFPQYVAPVEPVPPVIPPQPSTVDAVLGLYNLLPVTDEEWDLWNTDWKSFIKPKIAAMDVYSMYDMFKLAMWAGAGGNENPHAMDEWEQLVNQGITFGTPPVDIRTEPEEYKVRLLEVIYSEIDSDE